MVRGWFLILQAAGVRHLLSPPLRVVASMAGNVEVEKVRAGGTLAARVSGGQKPEPRLRYEPPGQRGIPDEGLRGPGGGQRRPPFGAR